MLIQLNSLQSKCRNFGIGIRNTDRLPAVTGDCLRPCPSDADWPYSVSGANKSCSAITVDTVDVDVLITGDKDSAGIDIDRPEILTPTEFLDKY